MGLVLLGLFQCINVEKCQFMLCRSAVDDHMSLVPFHPIPLVIDTHVTK